MARILNKIVYFMIVVLLSGCATGYGPNGLFGGYKERKLGEGKFIVSFLGNSNTTEQRVWNYWIYRCAELTSLNGYDYFELLPSKEHANGDEKDRPYQFTMIPSPLEISDTPRIIPVNYTYTTYTTYSSKAIVQMYKNPLPPNAKFVLDAKSIMNQLKPYVDSKGAATPPEKKDILVRAAVEAAIKSNRIKQEESNVLDGKLRQAM